MPFAHSMHAFTEASADRATGGPEFSMATGLDYFGARYFSGAQGRFTSPDKPFADQDPADPQSWNLYSYARNNPLKFVDDAGMAVIYADQRLRIISDARRQESTSYNTYLQGFEGNDRPDDSLWRDRK